MANRLDEIGLYGGFLDGDVDWGGKMNENLSLIDTLLHGIVEGIYSSPPAANSGSIYLVGSSPTGSFAGKTNQLMFYNPSYQWVELNASEGMLIYLKSEHKFKVKTSSGSWVNLYNFNEPLATVITANTTIANDMHTKTFIHTDNGSYNLDFTSETLAVGSILHVRKGGGTGTLTFINSTFSSSGSLVGVANYGKVDAYKISSSTWLLVGDLV